MLIIVVKNILFVISKKNSLIQVQKGIISQKNKKNWNSLVYSSEIEIDQILTLQFYFKNKFG